MSDNTLQTNINKTTGPNDIERDKHKRKNKIDLFNNQLWVFPDQKLL